MQHSGLSKTVSASLCLQSRDISGEKLHENVKHHARNCWKAGLITGLSTRFSTRLEIVGLNVSDNYTVHMINVQT